MKKTGIGHTLFFLFPVALLFTISFSSISSEVLAQTTVKADPEYFMGILILESQQQRILDSIKKVKDLQLGNMIILQPMDQAWNLTLVEEAIKEANNLGLYTIFETYNFSDHHVRISPEQFAAWKLKYPHLLGIMVSEITGKQADLNLWLNNTTKTIDTRLEVEEAIIENITSSMKLAEFKDNGARILLQENVIGYASANTSYCDVFISKVFNAPNTEVMIGLARGMKNSYNISTWGLWVDTWREWIKPPAFPPEDVEKALYEGWFYGAKYFFFEQGCFFGTLDRDWPRKHIILDSEGKLTEYGKVIQRFYAFLRNEKSAGYEQPDYGSPIAVMIGQSGWSGRGPDWGIWGQSDRQGDFDYVLLNLFFPGIGDNWHIGDALTGKEFTGLPFGMIDIISIYASPPVLKQYKVIIGLGWSLITDAIASNIEDYVQDGGIFLSFLTFTHGIETVDDLENPSAWTKSFATLFGISVNSSAASKLDITADTFLHNITFTQDTFWYPWNGETYSYFNAHETGSWFWKFEYELYHSKNTSVIAWVDGIQNPTNAFIVENKKDLGHTYIFNTRSPNSLPNGVFTEVITEFIHFLCTYYKRPMTYTQYPKSEYWLNQAQANRSVYLIHDNSTTNQTFTYYVRALDAGLGNNKEYIIFEYLNNEFYGITKRTTFPLNLTLQPNEAKLFLLLGNNGEPQVLNSRALLTATPTFADQHLTVFLEGIEETTNTTKIYCTAFERPRYVLGTPFNLTQSYNKENSILTVDSSSNFTISWENTTEVSVVASTVPLIEVSWNSTRGLLNVSANGTVAPKGSIQLQTDGKKPYYLKVDDVEISTWSYDASTGILSATFSLTTETAEVIVGFKQIEIDRAFVSDKRVDSNTVQTIGFHLAWIRNGSDVKGATIKVNGTGYITNQTGWISLDTSYDATGRLAWSTSGVKYNNITDYSKSVADPSIIWDRVIVTDFSIIEDVVQVGSFQTVWLAAEYEYDSVVFDNSKGTIFLNGSPMIWSTQNSRWEQNTTSSILGLQMYEATAVDDKIFGLTTIFNQDEKIEIIWDKIEIAKTEFKTNELGVTSIRVEIIYNCTRYPVVNADVSVNGEVCHEIEQGVYLCEKNDWSPFQSYLVEINYPDFEQDTKTLSYIHVPNTVLYASIGFAILSILAFYVLRKKLSHQKCETVSSGTPSNIRLLSFNLRKSE